MRESENALRDGEETATEAVTSAEDTAEPALDATENTSQEPTDKEHVGDGAVDDEGCENDNAIDVPSDKPLDSDAIERESNMVQPPSRLSYAMGGLVISKGGVLAFSIIVPICIAAAISFGVWIGVKKQDPWRIESGLVDYGGFSSEVGSTDQIVIPGYGEVLLDADTRDVMLILPNPAGNPCFFRFSIVLKESNEVIYTSGLVPPGKAIENLRLSRAIKAGNYPAIVQIETFSLDESRTPMNGANVEVILNFR